MFTIKNLTRPNVEALRALLTEEERRAVRVGDGRRIAQFFMTPGEAQRLIATLTERAAQQFGRSSTHYLALPAIARKIDEAASAALNPERKG